MFVALTGTPGTGKTSAATHLKTQYHILDINQIAQENNCITQYDSQRETAIVDINKINNALKPYQQNKELFILESHYAHLLHNISKVILLRCHPKTLYQRLQNKDWHTQKIRENLEAETLDIILCETTERHPKKNIFELDTTNLTITTVVKQIQQIIQSNFKPNDLYRPGKLDWSEEILTNYPYMQENSHGTK